MPPETPIPPEIFKEVLVKAGWTVLEETNFHWAMKRDGRTLKVPKDCDVLGLEVMEHCLIKADFGPGQYWNLLKQIGYKHYTN